jgi:hypothetical protein
VYFPYILKIVYEMGELSESDVAPLSTCHINNCEKCYISVVSYDQKWLLGSTPRVGLVIFMSYVIYKILG